ncbi:MAG: pyruvate kinase alpha/beta domain-containing protein [bacterium]
MGGTAFEVRYFASAGEANTDKVLDLVSERADELGIDTVIVASTRGETGARAVERLKGKTVIVVTHSTGFSGLDIQELTEENRTRIEEAGGRILTCQHALGGLGRAVRKKFGTYMTEEIVAHALRIFGEGMKVACEIVLMAMESGATTGKRDVIAVGGTSKGADTAVVIRPANVHAFFDMKVKEVICKPRLD